MPWKKLLCGNLFLYFGFVSNKAFCHFYRVLSICKFSNIFVFAEFVKIRDLEISIRKYKLRNAFKSEYNQHYNAFCFGVKSMKITWTSNESLIHLSTSFTWKFHWPLENDFHSWLRLLSNERDEEGKWIFFSLRFPQNASNTKSYQSYECVFSRPFSRVSKIYASSCFSLIRQLQVNCFNYFPSPSKI